MRIRLAVICLLFLVLGFKECEKLPPQAYKNKMSDAVEDAGKNPNGTVRTSRRVAQSSPKGVRVYSENGATPQQLSLIDDGVDDALHDARASGYNSHAPSYLHSWYGVLIFPGGCLLSPVSRTPSFLVRANNYDSGEYDAHFSIGFRPPIIEPVPGFPDKPPRTRYSMPDGRGVVYAAEMLMQMNPNLGDMLVCGDTSVLRNAVRFGAEHLKIGQEDSDYFAATVTHGPPHPLLPRRQVFTTKGNRRPSGIFIFATK